MRFRLEIVKISFYFYLESFRKMRNDKAQIEILDSRRLPVRIAIGAAIIFALAFGWFAVRWQLGDMLATLTSPADPNAQAAAALAVKLAPRDPLTNWLAASTKNEISSSVKDFETVIQYSPYDFRWWVELGRAYEQLENNEEAEKAYLRAVELAPAYSYPRWQLGNFYLRQNRSDEAFDELKKAAETNPVYRDQIFSLAWDFYNQDTARLEQIAGDSAAVKAGLARFYAAKERADDSLKIWNTLSEEEKRANVAYAQVIAQAFYEKRFYRQAIEFYRGLGIEPDAKAETILNAGFEKPIGDIKTTYFGWKVLPTEKMDVKLDPTKKHEGNRSLRVSFNGYSAATLYNITQIIVVEPSAKYRLTFWLRTENLKSGGTPKLEVANAKDGGSIATSAPFQNGTNDWQQVKVEFTAPENAEAVIVRTIRDFCGEGCPIFGTIWYDDFKLEKIK